ncbi:hypothetical protein FB451DRAFT_1561762 [Mycena latifolia]|nr:hypothetical protein FB451DRAFT_1561762 [Mycena latifolia]
MDSNALDFLRAQVWGLFLSGAGFGVYTITCGPCFQALFAARSRRRGLSDWLMLAVFLIFLAKTTSSAAIHLYLNLDMLEEPLDDAASEFMDGTSPINRAKSATILIQTIISSGVLIYRCWLVYSRALLVVALPLVLWLGGVAIMGIIIHIDTSVKVDGLFAMSQSRNFGSSFWAIIVTVNLITSALIARRVWTVDHLKSRPNFQTETDESTTPTSMKPSACSLTCQSNEKMKRTTRIIIESGLIYTTMTLLTFLLFVANNVVVHPATDALVQAIGISFNLMIIHNRPRTGACESTQSNMNGVPLQFTSTMSVAGSAIEFAYPKYWMPRRKNRSPAGASAQVDSRDTGALGTLEIPHSHSQHSQQSN